MGAVAAVGGGYGLAVERDQRLEGHGAGRRCAGARQGAVRGAEVAPAAAGEADGSRGRGSAPGGGVADRGRALLEHRQGSLAGQDRGGGTQRDGQLCLVVAGGVAAVTAVGGGEVLGSYTDLAGGVADRAGGMSAGA